MDSDVQQSPWLEPPTFSLLPLGSPTYHFTMQERDLSLIKPAALPKFPESRLRQCLCAISGGRSGNDNADTATTESRARIPLAFIALLVMNFYDTP